MAGARQGAPVRVRAPQRELPSIAAIAALSGRRRAALSSA
jgi:hypothetical protein